MNFVDKYVKFAEPLTEAPRTFHEYMGYLVLSQAIGRRILFTGAGSFPLGPNLWFILIGSSSLTKKTTTLRIATDHILFPAFKEMPFQYQSEGSQEAFIEELAARPSGLIAHSEFAGLKNWASRDYNSGLISLLTTLYDQPSFYQRKVGTREKAKIYTIRNPFINIVSCSTIDWFNSNLTENNITGGFLPRFMLIFDSIDKDIPLTPQPDMILQNELIREAQQYIERPESTVDYTPKAKDLYIKWYSDFKTKHIRKGTSLTTPFHSRRQTDIHKFAMLNSLMRGGSELNTDDFDQAKMTIDQITEHIDTIIADKLALSPYELTRNKVFELIKKNSHVNGGAPHSLILKQSKLDKRRFGEIIETLFDEKSIDVKKEMILGRAATFYKIVQGGGADASHN